MTGQSSFPLEATAADKFKSERAGIVLEFDAAKNQMILKQGEEIDEKILERISLLPYRHVLAQGTYFVKEK